MPVAPAHPGQQAAVGRPVVVSALAVPVVVMGGVVVRAVVVAGVGVAALAVPVVVVVVVVVPGRAVGVRTLVAVGMLERSHARHRTGRSTRATARGVAPPGAPVGRAGGIMSRQRHVQPAAPAGAVPVSQPAELLRAAGVRATPQRLMVLQALLEAGDRHLTADDVCRSVQDRYPSFNRSTTYRVLELLSALGLVQSTRLGDGVAHFEAVDHPDRHHHLVCVRCGSVQNVPADVLGEIGIRLAERHHFHIGTVDLMIQGECATCRLGAAPAVPAGR